MASPKEEQVLVHLCKITPTKGAGAMSIKAGETNEGDINNLPVNVPMPDSSNPRHYNAADQFACEQYAHALCHISTGDGLHPGNSPHGYTR
jgi:hypothetical protein